MWQFFTERSKRVVQIAHREALRLGHPTIGTGHLMIGLVAEESSVAALLLRNAGLAADDVARKILELHPPAPPTSLGPDLPLSKNARGVVEDAIHMARELHSSYVGTEHLLLGVLLNPACLACRALTSLGLDIEGHRDALKKQLAPEEPLRTKDESSAENATSDRKKNAGAR